MAPIVLSIFRIVPIPVVSLLNELTLSIQAIQKGVGRTNEEVATPWPSASRRSLPVRTKLTFNKLLNFGESILQQLDDKTFEIAPIPTSAGDGGTNDFHPQLI